MYTWTFNKTHSGPMSGFWYHDTKSFEITEELWEKASNCINSMVFELENLGHHTEKLEGETPGITVYYRSDYMEPDKVSLPSFFSLSNLIDKTRNPDYKEVELVIQKAFNNYAYENFSRSSAVIEKDQIPISISFTRPFNMEESNRKDQKDREERYRRESAIAEIMNKPVC